MKASEAGAPLGAWCVRHPALQWTLWQAFAAAAFFLVFLQRKAAYCCTSHAASDTQGGWLSLPHYKTDLVVFVLFAHKVSL